ncbi:F-box/LRR-repeat MAX2 homolog A-like [Phoenix dactylifera]|uniref:F-box/LRR-repeat MAX2 homolog A-like n=1 Tax=Phoenix dactylifera TaxID=42345 RepID=A0A8B7D445_PHODC|nr:F-box/LRR-repeat MAX2 homolog A-like [Phoenix dactylifera]
MAGKRATHIHELPESILTEVFALVKDVRSRNSAALVCRRWRSLERLSRTSLSLRGHVRNPFLLPTCFPYVSHLDLSLLSPWGHHPFLHPSPTRLNGHPEPRPDNYNGHHHLLVDDQQLLVAQRLGQAFPNVTSLTVYARDPSTLHVLAPRWPGLRHAKLVRWHQRPHHPLGADLAPLLAACPSLVSLDLSHFYCWTEDIPPALQAHPAAAASLARLDLLSASSAEGFRASELAAIAAACPNLRHLLAPCVFNPRYFEFVGDASLLALAAACPRLSLLHLVDPSTLSPARPISDPADDGLTSDDAGITAAGLESLFAALPELEDLALDLCHNVRDAGLALEALGRKCPRIKSLKVGHFHGVCRAAWLHLDGVSLCGGLQSLCIKNCPDLTDAGLAAIARGCRILSKLEIHGCGKVTEMGVKKLASMLRSTLVDVSISGCRQLDAARSLRALEPIRDRIERLHIDCVWVRPDLEQSPEDADRTSNNTGDLDELEEQEVSNESRNKKCRHDGDHSKSNGSSSTSSFWWRLWERLRYLSVWVPAGEVLSPLADAGLDCCPDLEEIRIKVEGDCRTCPRPAQRVFGLSSLSRYPRLAKMKLDCGEAIGYALTAPTGHMDLSLWERFHLHGIGDLNLYELDYWPPQDKEVNQRSLSLPATGLIQGCPTLRKLFIHGTTHEHFMRFFLMMPHLRDVQLREDYYPAPENDMSTEMRVDSCSRFEHALNSRLIPD